MSSLPSWIDLSNVTQRYGTNGETGIDIGTPFHTPITSPVNGTVLGRDDDYGAGGIISIQTTIAYPDGNGHFADRVTSLYLQHLDVIYSQWQPGVTVHIGDLIGLSGGQLQNGVHPVRVAAWSSGPHTEIGLSAPYGGAWKPIGPNLDPYPWLYSLADGSNPAPSGILGNAVLLAQTTTIGNAAKQQGWAQVCANIDNAMQFESVSGNFLGVDVGALFRNIGHGLLRGAFVTGGIVLIVAWLVKAGHVQPFSQSQGNAVGAQGEEGSATGQASSAIASPSAMGAGAATSEAAVVAV